MDTMKMKRRRGIYLALLTAALLIFTQAAWCGPASAASVQVDVAASEMTIDEEATINVTYAGENLGRVSGTLDYDTEVLSYLGGGSSEGDTGHIQLKEASSDGSSVSFQLRFRVLKAGSSAVKVTTQEAFDMDEASITPPEDLQPLNPENLR